MINWHNPPAIAMQPRHFRHFRRLRRLIWTLRCFMEYRSRLNAESWLQGSEPWPWRSIWQITQATVQNEADSNDRDGYAWDTPEDAVTAELECWTE